MISFLLKKKNRRKTIMAKKWQVIDQEQKTLEEKLKVL